MILSFEFKPGRKSVVTCLRLADDQAGLFTGVNYNGYGPPGGFCFDQSCGDAPVMVVTFAEDNFPPYST